MKGWVYVITNKAMPGIVKVGYSMKDPELRAAELNHTGSPHPYVVDYVVLVDEPRDIEQATHNLLRAHREGKEWFRCAAEDAVAAIKSVAGSQVQAEDYKRVNRLRAEEIVRQKEVREHTMRVADEEKRKQETIAEGKRQEILSRYESLLKAELPNSSDVGYSKYIFWGLVAFGWFLLFFILSGKEPGNTYFILMLICILLFFLYMFAFPFVEDYLNEKAKETDSYKSVLAKRNAELQALGGGMMDVSSEYVSGRHRSASPPLREKVIGRYCSMCRKMYQSDKCPTCGR